VEQYDLSADGQQHRTPRCAHRRKKWTYDAKIDPAARTGCWPHNRGLAISDGKIILAPTTPEDRARRLTKELGIRVGTSICIIADHAPRIAGDKVVIGVGGGEYFIVVSSRLTASRWFTRVASTRFGTRQTVYTAQEAAAKTGRATGRSTAVAFG
jgi:hypothetical protein